MMLEKSTVEFLADLSSSQPIPSGGGATAAVGAFAAALGLMVANLTVGKKKYADVEKEIKEVLEKLEILRDKMVALTDKDAECFEPLSKAYRLPKETQKEKEIKEIRMEEALNLACSAPLETMETVIETMELLEILGEKGSRLAISDVGVGVLFAQAALEGASLNVFINTDLMKNRIRAQELEEKADAFICKGRILQHRIYENVLRTIRNQRG